MLHLGLCDQLQLFGAFVGGVWSLTGWGYTVNYYINKYTVLLSSLLGWVSYMAFINVLGFNRCVHLCLAAEWKDRLFGPKATKVWICVCWLYAACWVCFYGSPFVTWLYQPAIFVYFYDMSQPWTQISIAITWWSCAINQTCTIVWYTVIGVSIRLQVASIEQASVAVRTMEKALLKQAVIICFMLLVVDGYWHLVLHYVCDLVGSYCFAFGNKLAILNTGINPLVYLCINKTISGKVWKMFGCKSNQVAQQPFPARGSKTRGSQKQITKPHQNNWRR